MNVSETVATITGFWKEHLAWCVKNEREPSGQTFLDWLLLQGWIDGDVEDERTDI